MRISRLFATAAVLAAVSCVRHSDDPEERAAEQLALRVMPRGASRVEFVCEPGEEDFYTLETVGRKLVVTGNNANSMAMGLGDYLRDWCMATVTYYKRDGIDVPRRLPALPEKIERRALVRDRFFFNYCTYGYSLDWFKWDDWERMIDWMALNGVNMVLANTGQESVWLEVWQQFGLSEQQVREYFVGPAYLSWHRMTNMDKWDSPLPMSWLDGQKELQKKIIARESELGISPILASFTGHVPAALREVYPEADITTLSDWGGFEPDCYANYLSPKDSLFPLIQEAFLRKQAEIYGQDCHIYGIDLFNEVDPPQWTAEYLSEAARLTYEAITKVDPEAVWLQMAWLFYYEKRWTPELIEAYLSPVPKGRLVMLDYYCDKAEVWRRTDGFYGQDFIWSYLGNFGGRTVIGGNIKDVSAKLDRTLEEAPGCVGVGCTLEGLGVNPEMCEYVLGRGWQKQVSDSVWVSKLADRHVGFEDESAREAWQLMYDRILNLIADRGSLVTVRPSFRGRNSWTRVLTEYSNADLLEVWRLLLEVRGSSTPSYRFDCVNTARQCLDNYFTELYLAVLEAYKNGDVEVVKRSAPVMISIIDDMDELCATDTYFLLGKWVADARSWGDTQEEADYYEHDARNILSTWGVKGCGLTDYANRDWNGLLGTYYKPRWEKFLDELIKAMEAGVEIDYPAYKAWAEDFEWNWIDTPYEFISSPVGDPIAVSRRLYSKYESLIRGE